MQRTLFILAALLFSGSALFAQAEATAAKEVTFKARPHKKGDKIAASGKETSTFNMSISFMDQEQNQSQEEQKSVAFSLEALAVDEAGVVTKVKGKITKWDKKEKAVMPMMGESESGLSDAQSAVIGKEFILDTSASPATVTDAQGEALPSDQADAIREEILDDAGRIESFRPEMSDVIPEKLKIGETVKLTGAQIAKFMGMDDDENAEQLGEPDEILSGTLKLKEVRSILGNQVGVFDVDIKMSADVQGAAIKANPVGEMHIGINDKYTYKVDVKGKMTMNGSQAMPGPDGEEIEITLSGGGDMNMSMQAIYANVK